MNSEKGYNVNRLDFLPSGFRFYTFKKIRVQDLSISQTTNLSILNGAQDLNKLIEIYTPSFIDLTPDQVRNLLYIDFIACVHYINHLTFGLYNNSFKCSCTVCGEPAKVEYNLYDIDFSFESKVFDSLITYNKDISIYLGMFTVDKMATLISLGLEDNKEAFIASCIEAVSLKQGEYCEDFKDFETKINKISEYPFRMKVFITEEISKRYPQIKPIQAVLSCGHIFKFVPDLTLKGLPTFTSI